MVCRWPSGSHAGLRRARASPVGSAGRAVPIGVLIHYYAARTASRREAPHGLRETRLERRRLRGDPAAHGAGRGVVGGPGQFARERGGGHGIVELPERVLRGGERFEVGARALARKERGEELGDVAQALRGDARRVPLLVAGVRERGREAGELAMAPREELRGEPARGAGSAPLRQPASRRAARRTRRRAERARRQQQALQARRGTAARASLRAARRRASRAREGARCRAPRSRRARTRR